MQTKSYLFLVSIFSFLVICCSQSPTIEEMYSQGYQLEDEKKYKEAILVYDKILKKNPKLEDAYFRKGSCYLGDSNYAEALHYYDFLLSRRKHGNIIITTNKEFFDGGDVSTHQISTELLYYQIGIVKYFMDSLQSSYSCFQYAVQNNFEVAGCYTWQGLILLRAGKHEKGCDLLKKSMEMGNEEGKNLFSDLCKDKSPR